MGDTMAIPASTYRLQVRPGFDLAAAARLVDYLADLGADWVYLSPLLEAEDGSDHGYDVVNHSRIDPARGGAEGLELLSRVAHERGMGVLVDIVPNHVGVATPAANAWWWDVLARGRASRFAEAFDIDWEFGGEKLRIPVLGDDTTLSLIDGQLDYFGLRFPIAEGTLGGTAHEVHARQHYELVDWRRADGELNYRRFFAVNSLAGIRVELPWVFEESHAEITRWIRADLVDGLRVDHPDGLLDPGRYLDDLAAATDSTYVLVEKILEGDERMPAHWQAAGTTGYDALADIDRILVDPKGRAPLDRLDDELRGTGDKTGKTPSWPDLIHDTKRGIADGILRSEIRRIARLLAAEFPDSVDPVEDAIAELAACFPVYRSYLPLGLEHLEAAAADARARRPDLAGTIDALLPALRDPGHPAAQRLQQTTGMVMAKGVEDTAFYRYSRLSSLTEVGGDPAEFFIPLAEFHRRQELRQAGFPASLTTLSTHDTKRSEDVRARIDVLSEIAGQWRLTLETLRRLAPLGDGPLENLLWESIVGVWPASRERLHAYAEKAAREAGSSTTWAKPKPKFEARMHALVDAAFDDPEVAAVLDEIVARGTPAGWSNSLAAKLIQLTAPGVPDVYQGTELWEHSLVDPDNRRPVDFELRRRLLAELAQPPVDKTGAAKLLVTTRALQLRRDRPELFTRYVPLDAVGEAADHLIAFDRGDAVTLATRLPLGLAGRGGWGDTRVLLPHRRVTDVLTGIEYEGGELALAEVFAVYPVALLV